MLESTDDKEMATMTMTDAAIPRGLKGVIVADTGLGDVRGTEGFYHYRHYSAPELAAKRTFEDVWHLMFEGELPEGDAGRRFAAEVASNRALPDELLDVLALVAPRSTPMESLRTGLSHLAALEQVPPSHHLDHELLLAQSMRLAAAAPTIVAASSRIGRGLEPIAPK